MQLQAYLLVTEAINKMSKQHRIKFRSAYDMASVSSLTVAETIFQNWDLYIHSTEINDLLELYN